MGQSAPRALLAEMGPARTALFLQVIPMPTMTNKQQHDTTRHSASTAQQGPAGPVPALSTVLAVLREGNRGELGCCTRLSPGLLPNTSQRFLCRLFLSAALWLLLQKGKGGGRGLAPGHAGRPVPKSALRDQQQHESLQAWRHRAPSALRLQHRRALGSAPAELLQQQTQTRGPRAVCFVVMPPGPINAGLALGWRRKSPS